jgi:hypothetical protein
MILGIKCIEIVLNGQKVVKQRKLKAGAPRGGQQQCQEPFWDEGLEVLQQLRDLSY